MCKSQMERLILLVKKLILLWTITLKILTIN